MGKGIKGYKVFNPDWTCRDFQYTCPGIFEEDVKPVVCERGFHFCEKVSDCFEYYNFNPENKVAEVIALGEVNSNGKKSCTNEIQIVREIPWQELLTIVNEGKNCIGNRNTGNCNTGNCNTGDCNTGNRNTGDWNTGDCNTGSCNTGDWNTGDCNTGNRNTGDCNTGNRNTGDWNTGNCNTGNCNTGDWNCSSFNTGCFNTGEQKIIMFDKPSNWTYKEWINSDARQLLNQIPKKIIEWVSSSSMTDEEKAAYPVHETVGGYLKVLDESECGQLWWDGLEKYQREIVFSLPNFDPDIFEQCTGIKVKKAREY